VYAGAVQVPDAAELLKFTSGQIQRADGTQNLNAHNFDHLGEG